LGVVLVDAELRRRGRAESEVLVNVVVGQLIPRIGKSGPREREAESEQRSESQGQNGKRARHEYLKKQKIRAQRTAVYRLFF